MDKTNGFTWRGVFAGIAVAALGVCFSGIAFAAGDVDNFMLEKLNKFTPPDITLVAPAENVPKECAALAGLWGPSAIPQTNAAVKMVVEDVTADCTIKVVVVGATRRSYGNDDGAGWVRQNAKVENGEISMLSPQKGSKWKVKIMPSGTELDVIATNAAGQIIHFTISR
jgi:hypothetical protein